MKVDDLSSRAFYEIEAIKNNWTGRELERQINSLLSLATKGRQVQKPADHVILKCYVLIDLKVGKLTRQDLGQMQLYVNRFDKERRVAGDGPTLGLILCTDKNDAVVRYTLGDAQPNIFASRYRLHLPSDEELKARIRKELLALRS